MCLLGGFIWYTKVYQSPYNVYWGMLENSLATSSVTKHITQTANGAQLDQYVAFNFGANNQTYAKTILKNSGGTVKTESMGTLNDDYVRYTDIQTAQKDSQGRPLQVNALLGKWAKVSTSNTNNAQAPPFFAQALLGFTGGNLVPMANLSSADRHTLMNQLHQSTVFDTVVQRAEHRKQDGRSVYVYSVNIEPVGYVAFQKAFAHAIGLKTLDDVDPNAYQNQSPIQVKFTVDASSHQLRGITYNTDNHTETYSSYGVYTAVALPQATISAQALQSLIRTLQ